MGAKPVSENDVCECGKGQMAKGRGYTYKGKNLDYPYLRCTHCGEIAMSNELLWGIEEIEQGTSAEEWAQALWAESGVLTWSPLPEPPKE